MWGLRGEFSARLEEAGYPRSGWTLLRAEITRPPDRYPAPGRRGAGVKRVPAARPHPGSNMRRFST